MARSESVRGELTLHRRADGALELRVNGVFVMDTEHTSSERLLATAPLARLTRGRSPSETAQAGAARPAPWSVLVGGLGLGYTLAQLLQDHRVGRVVVAEIEEQLVRWHRSGVVPAPAPALPQLGQASTPLADPRVSVAVGDVRDVVRAQPSGSIDALLLDVDNGPGFLVYDSNASAYGDSFLAVCATALRPDGVLAIWSSDESTALAGSLARAFQSVEQRAVPVVLGRRQTDYHLLVASEPV